MRNISQEDLELIRLEANNGCPEAIEELEYINKTYINLKTYKKKILNFFKNLSYF